MARTIAALTALLMSAALTLAAQAPGRWITNKYAPLPQPEEEYTAVVSHDRLY